MSEPLLPDVTSDESGVGWGDDAGEDRDDERSGDAESDDEARLKAERPPHHDRP